MTHNSKGTNHYYDAYIPKKVPFKPIKLKRILLDRLLNRKGNSGWL